MRIELIILPATYSNMSTISIEQMEFYAYHGCFREEQIIGTRFLVDLYLDLDTQKAEKTDGLADTVNYQEVYLLVKRQMDIKSKLLEHVGKRILDAIRENYPQVSSARLKISKMNPPLGGKIGNVSLIMQS
jgi:dihydroneopterin aldolase